MIYDMDSTSIFYFELGATNTVIGQGGISSIMQAKYGHLFPAHPPT